MFCGVKKRGKTKNSFLFRSSFFLKSHPTLLFMVLAGCFLLIPGVQFAQAGWFEDLTSPTAWINALIYPFFLFFSWIVNLAAGIFVWVINAETFTKLMNAGAIYEVWLIVRDFLNIFFILVLLFSAFATIFQLDKYEYKRTIPMLVIMALLVNFSFPVARFVIDLANVPMYFFSQNIFGVDGPNEITSGILSGTKMQNILIPGVDNKDLKDFETTHLLAATICMFLFGISFLVLAILMLVRMIALAILVMFSPIGFVGMITPALQSFAKGWWDKLFKWAFYGPIAVMFVLVSVIVMKSAGDSIYPSAGAGGVFQSTGSSVNDNMVSAVAFFTIPIVLFWIAITSTEKYSNDISGLGIKWGSQLGRWMGRRGWHMPVSYPLRRFGVTGGIKQAWNDRVEQLGFGKEAQEKRERWVAGKFGGDRARTRLEQEDKRLTDEVAKKMDMGNLGDKRLGEIIANGNKHEKAAALTELAERGNADRKDLASMRKIFGKDSQVTRAFEAKMRTFDPVAVFTDRIDLATGSLLTPVNADGLKNFVKSNRFDPKKLLAGSITPELLHYAFEAKNISNKDLDELRAKGSEYVGAIEKSLDAMIVEMNTKQGGVWDMKDDVQRSVQMTHVAQTGNFHSSVDSDDAIKATLFEKADGDILKRIKSATLASGNNMDLFVSNVRGKYADIISKMAETGTEGLANAKSIKDYVDSAGIVGGPPIGGMRNVDRLKSLNNDHRIRYI